MTDRSVVIAGVEVTTDAEGRFSLNALHRASGAEKKNGPSYWLALDSTKSLTKELKKQTTGIPVVTVEGRNGGTFAVEQLAVAYANWISPTFYLQVINTFLESKKRTPQTPGEALVEMAQNFLHHERQIAALAHQQAETAAQVIALVNGEDYWTIVGYGNLIGEKVDVKRSQKLGKIATRICRENGWQKTDARHPIWGVIGSYPRQAVALAFDQDAA